MNNTSNKKQDTHEILQLIKNDPDMDQRYLSAIDRIIRSNSASPEHQTFQDIIGFRRKYFEALSRIGAGGEVDEHRLMMDRNEYRGLLEDYASELKLEQEKDPLIHVLRLITQSSLSKVDPKNLKKPFSLRLDALSHMAFTEERQWHMDETMKIFFTSKTPYEFIMQAVKEGIPLGDREGLSPAVLAQSLDAMKKDIPEGQLGKYIEILISAKK